MEKVGRHTSGDDAPFIYAHMIPPDHLGKAVVAHSRANLIIERSFRSTYVARAPKRSLGSSDVPSAITSNPRTQQRSWSLKSLLFAQLPLQLLRRNAKQPHRDECGSAVSSLSLLLSRHNIIVLNDVILSRSRFCVRHGPNMHLFGKRIKISLHVEYRGPRTTAPFRDVNGEDVNKGQNIAPIASKK